MIAPAQRVEPTLTSLATDRPGQAMPFVPLLIAADHCKGCALCVGACAKGALAIDESVVNALGYHPVHLVAIDSCTSCALCARVCPDCVLTVFAMVHEARTGPARQAVPGSGRGTPQSPHATPEDSPRARGQPAGTSVAGSPTPKRHRG